MPDQDVIAAVDSRVGRLRLNRPAALNALNLPMIEAFGAALAGWRGEPSIQAVVLEGEGRAFCAGGDVRAIRDHALAGEAAPIEAFFRAEYALNQAIADFPVPYVALIDGPCLGGGIGLSVHGAFRVATESAMLAMPETAIALFPDVGTTFVLPRLPGELGLFLALTGERMRGPDAVHAGFCTHFVPREKLPALSAALARDGAAVLAGFAETLPPFTLAEHRDAIDRCFSAASVPEIFARLAAEATPWAEATLATLGKMSPSSLCWSFAAVRAGASRTLPQCLAAELSLTRPVTRHPDFAEGVRAMVVDKDRAPRWSPARLEDVDPSAIAAMLAE
jgi:enoyl-CoA hydratase/carnithine racemase